MGKSGEEGLPRDLRRLCRVMDIFIILIMVMVSWGYTCQNKNVPFKHTCFIVFQPYCNKAIKNKQKNTLNQSISHAIQKDQQWIDILIDQK